MGRIETARPCHDCEVDTSPWSGIGEMYMVAKAIWNEAVDYEDRRLRGFFLCIGCLEKRLGRVLTPHDFICCPLNYDVDFRSKRLVSRLRSGSLHQGWAYVHLGDLPEADIGIRPR